jgi:transketolase
VRNSFIHELHELARRDDRIVLLTGDLGYLVVDAFAKELPRQFFNVGVSEQNMLGLAVGLAEAGYRPFCYSIATFAALRPYEFIRNGAALHRLPIRIVGVGGGFEYGHNGITHYALEDVAVMRVQPELKVVVPADAPQARAALRATHARPAPIYFRLGKDEKTLVPGLDGRFRVGGAEVVREGPDVALVAMGPVAAAAVAAAEKLDARGVRATVVVVAGLAPAPEEDLAAVLARHRVAVTAEAHYLPGGLGSLVCEVVAERGLACRVVRCGVERMPIGVTGSEAFMNAAAGIDAEAIAGRALQALQGGRNVG